MALIALIALSSGVAPFNMVRLLLVLTVLTLIPLMGAHVAYLSNKRKGFDQKWVLALDTLILIILVIIEIFAPRNGLLLVLASLLILCAVFLEKSHLMRQYQIAPTLPLPYSRYQEVPKYAPTTDEWVLALGSVVVCVFLSTVIIFLKVG